MKTPCAVRSVFVFAAVLGLGGFVSVSKGQSPGAKIAPATYKTETNLSYVETAVAEKADDYQLAQCRFDLYAPENRPGFATVIWLHGGGLTGGKRSFPQLKEKEIAIVSPSYRLSPKVHHDLILGDAAAVTAWTLRHIAERGGDPKKVFLAGHSAGGYLAAMVGMEPRWLAAHGLTHRQLAGLILVSAQVTTHFAVKKLRGDTGPEFRPIIDDYAPLYWASKDLPPVLLVTGDRRIEYKNRVEENDLFATSLRNLGHTAVEFHEMGGLDHGSVRFGAWVMIPGFIQKTGQVREVGAGP
ncbi:MAG TPA: alpha/beta hydrolase [Rariglobus sp.]